MVATASALMAAAPTGIVVILVLLSRVVTVGMTTTLAAMTVIFLVTALTFTSIFVSALLIATATLALGLVSSLLLLLLILVGCVVRAGLRSRRRLKSSRRGRVGASMDLLEVDWRRRYCGLLLGLLVLLGIIHDRGPVDWLGSSRLGWGNSCSCSTRLALAARSSGRGGLLARLIHGLALVLLLVRFLGHLF